MAWSADDFKAKVRELHRSHLFEIQFIFPEAVPGGTSDLLTLLVKAADAPGRSVAAVDCTFAGQPYQLAGKLSYQPWKVTFRLDDNIDVYKKVRAWSELIIGSELNLAAFATQFKSNINIYLLDGNANRLTGTQLVGAWPSDIGAIALDTTDKKISEFDVTFVYDYSVFKVE